MTVSEPSPPAPPGGEQPTMEAPTEPQPGATSAPEPGAPPLPPPMAPPVSWEPAPPAHPGPMPGLRYAGFWVRVVAYIIDSIVVAIIVGALTPVFGGMTITQTTGTVQVNPGAFGFNALVGLVYFVGFWLWRSQTPGMIPFGMRVVRADDGGSLDFGRALLRYVGLIISFVVIFLGVAWVAFDGRKQGWHDKLAGTLVVRPG